MRAPAGYFFFIRFGIWGNLVDVDNDTSRKFKISVSKFLDIESFFNESHNRPTSPIQSHHNLDMV